MAAEHLQGIVEALEGAFTQSGERLVELCDDSPVLLVFLRHAGCTFCREALADLARERAAVEESGTRIVLVHMGDSKAIGRQIERYGLAGIDRIRDEEQVLYRAFGLKQGTLRQLFGPKVLWRAFGAGVLARHGIGGQKADSFQMPGLFLLDSTGIIRRFRHRSAADRPNYTGLATLSATAAAE